MTGSSLNWNICYSIYNNRLYSFVFNWNEMLSINFEYSFYLWFFSRNFNCCLENSSVQFWDYIQWDISYLSYLESIDLTLRFWDDSRFLISISWSCVNWDVCNSIYNNILYIFDFNWNVVLSIYFNYRFNCLFFDDFFYWFENSSMNFWNYIQWNIGDIFNFESVNMTSCFWANS